MRVHMFPGKKAPNSRQIQPTSQELLSNLQTKRTIINQLIEGRLPLFEAAAQFQQAHRSSATCLEDVTGIPAILDSESICRTVIGWVQLTLSDRPEHAERISQQLELELQSHLERFGKVNLAPKR